MFMIIAMGIYQFIRMIMGFECSWAIFWMMFAYIMTCFLIENE